MYPRSRQAGMTLIEVLVALVVFSIGALGVAMLQLNALKHTDSAMRSTQASFIAQDLLERIRDTGSIAAAGRTMSMSYKRAWSLVEEMNKAFREPLVDSTRGGAKGGGAHLTAAGETVLSNYRKLEEITAEAGAARIGLIRSMLRDIPEGK